MNKKDQISWVVIAIGCAFGGTVYPLFVIAYFAANVGIYLSGLLLIALGVCGIVYKIQTSNQAPSFSHTNRLFHKSGANSILQNLFLFKIMKSKRILVEVLSVSFLWFAMVYL
jgi:hypothetical protein